MNNPKTNASRTIAISLLVLIISIAMLMPAGGMVSAAAPGNRQPMAGDSCVNFGDTISTLHSLTGKTNFVGTAPGRPIPNPAGISVSASGEEAARGYLGVCGSMFGLRDQKNELALKRETAAGLGRSTVRFQQLYRGIPILGGELVVLTDKDKNIVSVAGEILPDVEMDVQPAVDASTAMNEALQVVAKQHEMPVENLVASQPELWIYNPSLISPLTGISRLVWRMEITPVDLAPIRELTLVDAVRGSVVLNFNQVDTALNRITYTANNTTTLPGTVVCNESSPTCAAGDTDAKNAHIFAGDTYDFYNSTHGRDSIDNAGMTLKSTVHYDTGFCNAFWDGTQMVYGDGCFIVVDDVVGHELTHGVTENESGLFYYYQSGAINESFSDVWGEFIDQTNGAGTDTAAVKWLVGEDVSIGAFRNMKNPAALGDPDKITSANYSVDESDNGGVHTNSGVNNKAAYLMTDGGTFNGKTVTALGITKVAKIYYEAQQNLLISGSDYLDLYNALYQACQNLVGTSGITAADCTQVRNATQAVEMNLQPVAGFNSEAPVCASGQSAVNKFIDNLEAGSGKWVFAASPGTVRWQYDSPYGSFAHSGSHFLYSNDYPAATTSTTATMKTGVVIPAGAYLLFHHAYGFEDPAYDGGVLEYTIDGGTTWKDAGSLFTHNGYTGTISPSFGNPLAGRSGFVGDSHGYRSSRLNLNTLSGKTVRFRWRMGLDGVGYDWGWWLDDVRIYTCASFSPIPQSPAGTISDTTPTFKWTRISGATKYQFDVYQGTTLKYTKVVATSACGSSSTVCSNTPTNVLSSAAHKWKVRAFVGGVWKPYSAYKNFTITTTSTGPKAGFWESNTGDEFYVTTNQKNVNAFAIYVTISGCGNIKITHVGLLPIANKSFSFTGSFYANGTFDTATSAHGTDGLSSFFIANCGTFTGGPWAWTATWKNSTQPLVNTIKGDDALVEFLSGPKLFDLFFHPVEKINP